ncbi:MAG: Anti-sigma factor antagonist [Nocardioides sp.]|jgi:anti-anti-sigma factor|nr:Anti-sigma factor antagonist [Nocardioides sp.]
MRTNETLTMNVTGDLDLEGALRLREAVRDQVAIGVSADVTMDLSRVRFIDCAGVGALMWTRRRLDGGGGTLVLTGGNRTVMRLLEPLGLARLLPPA